MRVIKIKKSITDRSSLSLEKYFTEVSRISILSSEHELFYIKAYRNGDKKAFEILAKSNLRFVISVAKAYQYQGLNLEDLINEGNIGLIKAIERYDETKGFKFISYAVWWIRQSITQALRDHARMVRMPQSKILQSKQIKKVYDQFEQENCREPEYFEVEDLLSINEREVQFLQSQHYKHISLSEPVNGFVGQDNGITLEQKLESDESCKADFLVDENNMAKLLSAALNILDSREQTILKASFVIGYTGPLKLEEIGALCGLTRERVRQLREKAIQRLRSVAVKRMLRQCL